MSVCMFGISNALTGQFDVPGRYEKTPGTPRFP